MPLKWPVCHFGIEGKSRNMDRTRAGGAAMCTLVVTVAMTCHGLCLENGGDIVVTMLVIVIVIARDDAACSNIWTAIP